MSGRLAIATLILGSLSAAPAFAQSDVDGPDCGRPIQDFGDAPEGVVLPYLRGGMAHYPTCLSPGAPGTQEVQCPARSTPPGPTGYMKHVQDGTANYWLIARCDPSLLAGIDSEADGKFSYPTIGPSLCDPAVDTDPFPGFSDTGQDEYRGDDGDAGVSVDLLLPCADNVVHFGTANCGPPRTAYLNVLVDMNFDGDWNDNGPCSGPYVYCFTTCDPGVCAHEWAVKNAPVLVANGCEDHVTPVFRVGTLEGLAWMRLSLTDEPVDDDYPWAGSANRPGGVYHGGETEDYLVSILTGDPVKPSSWGQLKIRYQQP